MTNDGSATVRHYFRHRKHPHAAVTLTNIPYEARSLQTSHAFEVPSGAAQHRVRVCTPDTAVHFLLCGKNGIKKPIDKLPTTLFLQDPEWNRNESIRGDVEES